MTILYISWLNKLFFGGVEKRAQEFFRVSSLKNRTDMLTINTIGRKKLSGSPDIHELIFPFSPYKWKKDFWEIIFLIRASFFVMRNKHKFPLVHGQGVNGFPGIINKIPTVICMHGGKRDFDKPGILGWLWRKTINNADYIFAISQKVRQELIDRKVDSEKIVVVYNGVNTNSFFNLTDTLVKRVSKKYNLNDKNQYILSVQNLVNKKRTKELLFIYRSIQNEFPDFELIICGDGPNREQLAKIIEDNNIRARLLGSVQVDEIPVIYNLSSIFVLNSIGEGLPVVFTEAMAAGCAIVASSSGSSSEILKSEYNALLNEEFDDVKFKSNLLRVLRENKLRIKLRSNAREESKQFDWLCQFEKVETIYDKLLKKND